MVEFALQLHNKKNEQLNSDISAQRVPDVGELIISNSTTYTVTGVHWFLSNGTASPVVLAEEQ